MKGQSVSIDQRWKVLRERYAGGDVGGPNDGPGDSGGDDLWEIEFECRHGTTITEAPVGTFVDLLAWMNVTVHKHIAQIRCRCTSPNDREMVAAALAAWREAFGIDPVVDLSDWGANWA
jgi:hypothetical protein